MEVSEVLLASLLLIPSLILVSVLVVVRDTIGGEHGEHRELGCVSLFYVNLFVSVSTLLFWGLYREGSDIFSLLVGWSFLYAIITILSMHFIYKCCREMRDAEMKRGVGKMLGLAMRP
ncbi:MAG: hypothetical protein OXU73_01390 [Candidatus Campbellbacteria bacterium]|nr:hypothetical protein [Candidatus Campbellbacteria bacterium]